MKISATIAYLKQTMMKTIEQLYAAYRRDHDQTLKADLTICNTNDTVNDVKFSEWELFKFIEWLMEQEGILVIEKTDVCFPYKCVLLEILDEKMEMDAHRICMYHEALASSSVYVYHDEFSFNYNTFKMPKLIESVNHSEN